MGNDRMRARPAVTPEARERELIGLAIDLAEKQLRSGKASSQVITHYLKLATNKDRIDQEILEKKKDLISAKTDALKATKQLETMYQEAMSAMRRYSGGDSEDD